MKPSTEMPGKAYLSMGRCIYCAQPFPPTELTDEHIIPLALNGSLIIRKAACEPCRKRSNEVYENVALQADLLVPRLLLELKRRKKETPKKFPLVALGNRVLDSAALFTLELTLSQHPTIFFSLLLPPLPGRLEGVDRGNLTSPRLAFVNLQIATSAMRSSVTMRHKFNPTAFGLTLVKIGYCFAVAERGLNSFDSTEVRALLLGERHDLFNFFGSALPGDTAGSAHLHSISLIELHGVLVSRVHLFASCKMLPYYVVLGRLV